MTLPRVLCRSRHDERRKQCELRRIAIVVAAATTAILTSGLGGAPAHAAIYPLPDPDGFYAAPPNIGDYQPGDVVRSRQVPAGGYPGAVAWQLLFRSSNSADQPIAAVTTLLVPGGVGANRPLVSYQPFVNSLGLQCAPSHSLFDGSLQEAPALNLLLARGWAVAVPDHLGPTSAYGAARLGGRLTLDGIRAVKRFGPAGLGDSPVGMAGYSGGGMATGFAAALAPEYAPELPIVGVAMGGVPVNIGKLALDVGRAPSPLFGLGFAAAVGLEREYPSVMSLDHQLTPAGQELRARLANACTSEIISAGANHSFFDFLTGSIDDVTDAQIQVLHENSLETYPGVPRAPLYQWAGTADQVNPWLARDVAGRYCAAGDRVLFDLIPGADHGTAIAPGAANAYGYLADRFAGLPAPSNC
ncbi:lipase [Nocardia terpenica]|uniref:lipase family protein n=1 Tax=Nocardia terpenica TaxID=455432 RepID=UPI001893AC7C|nr:lipase [Nocardia terpenica]MBF6106010.1 lipase [Nocardia terpenica]MBF6113405.1 lipase [Nocardia terpenica]MBF6119751.1 lipase [Nocardia terpenica]MBF6152162.1 lipase [Nocardia terpenica]